MNLATIIDGHPDDATALIYRGRTTTYGELGDQVARLRGGLRSLGVSDGDRVAIALDNSVQFAVAYLAILGVGAVAVPLNPLSPGPELEHEISRVAAKVVFIERASTAAWSHVDRSVVSSVSAVVTCDRADAPEDAVCFDDLLANEPIDLVEVDPEHLAVLIFTSGTAGSPRAAMLTHGNLLANIEQARSASGYITATDVIYGVLPLYHIFGLNVVLGLGLHVGASILLVQRFDPATAVDSIRDRGVTVFPGAPTIWNTFAHFEELPPDAFSSIRLALSGASRLPVPTAERMLERFGLELREGYGLTEASPIVTTSVGGPVKFGSVGRALDGVEVRVVNDGGDVLVGDVGEIRVRGANVFAGYYQDADATDRVLTPDGWLCTGDMATIDDDGYLYLVDRAKDLIIVSGFNVYPAEVEEVLAAHPEVEEVGVVGVPHPHTGEAVRAFVVTTPDSTIDEDGLIEFALDHLARYKCPTKVLFVDELPRNASGKLVRRNLVVA